MPISIPGDLSPIEITEDTPEEILDSLWNYQTDENGNFESKHIQIQKLFINDIDIDRYYNKLLTSETNYTDFDYYQNYLVDSANFPLTQMQNTMLGAEGRWSMKFDSPVYIWMLEDI